MARATSRQTVKALGLETGMSFVVYTLPLVTCDAVSLFITGPHTNYDHCRALLGLFGYVKSCSSLSGKGVAQVHGEAMFRCLQT